MQFDEEWASQGAHETDWNDREHVGETYVDMLAPLEQAFMEMAVGISSDTLDDTDEARVLTSLALEAAAHEVAVVLRTSVCAGVLQSKNADGKRRRIEEIVHMPLTEVEGVSRMAAALAAGGETMVDLPHEWRARVTHGPDGMMRADLIPWWSDDEDEE